MPIVITGLGGAFSVVAVNSWMNQPQGFSPTTGDVTSVEPLKVIFNPAVPYEVPHMILAAYLVTGFIVASVYAVGMLRGRRDRYHRLGLLIPLTVACIATPIQFAVGDSAARAIAKDQPIKFAAMECVQTTSTDVTEYIYGRCTPDGVKGGIGIPGFDSFLVGWSTSTQVTGLDTVPPDDRPPANTMLHWAFDTMVGICTMLIALGAWLAFVWWRKRDFPQTKWFLRATALSGIAAVVALECGWIVTEVGRQPWVVYNVMRTEDAVTKASGVGVTFAVVIGLYVVLGAALIIALRAMARRWRAAAEDDASVPYGPTRPRRCRIRYEQRRRRRRRALDRGDDVRRLRRRGLRGRPLEPDRRRRRARPQAPRADRLGDRARVGSEPRVADLRARGALDRLLGGVRGDLLDLFIPLSLAALGVVLRGAGFAFHKTARRVRGRAVAETLFGLASLLTPFFMGTVVGAIAGGRVPVGNAAGDAVTQLVQPAVAGDRRAVRRHQRLPRRRVPRERRPARRRGRPGALLQDPRARRRRRTGALAAVGLVALHADARFVYDGLTGDGLPLVILSLACGGAVLVLLHRGAARGPRPLAVGAVAAVIWGWGVAQYPYLLPKTLTIADAAAPSATLTGLLIVAGAAVVLVVPAIGLLFTLVQETSSRRHRSLRPRRRRRRRPSTSRGLR